MRITSLFSLNAIALDVAASNQDEPAQEDPHRVTPFRFY